VYNFHQKLPSGPLSLRERVRVRAITSLRRSVFALTPALSRRERE
jgi:hypothetical protein